MHIFLDLNLALTLEALIKKQDIKGILNLSKEKDLNKVSLLCNIIGTEMYVGNNPKNEKLLLEAIEAIIKIDNLHWNQ